MTRNMRSIKYIENGQAPGWYWFAGISDRSGREMNDGPFPTARAAIEDYIETFETDATVVQIAREQNLLEDV